MEVQFRGRNLRIPEPLRAYTQKRLAEKVGRLLKDVGSSEAQVLLAQQHGQHTAEISLKVDATVFRAEGRAADLRAAVDGALDKLDRQMRKVKERLRERKRG